MAYFLAQTDNDGSTPNNIDDRKKHHTSSKNFFDIKHESKIQSWE
jgi:hypothetical protein